MGYNAKFTSYTCILGCSVASTHPVSPHHLPAIPAALSVTAPSCRQEMNLFPYQPCLSCSPHSCLSCWPHVDWTVYVVEMEIPLGWRRAPLRVLLLQHVQWVMIWKIFTCCLFNLRFFVSLHHLFTIF